MDKRFLAIVIGIIIVFVGFIVFRGGDESTTNDTATTLTNHVKGTGTSGVTFTEYGDFQCPACFQYYPILDTIAKEYGDRITFQFRHFPLISIHKNAFGASRAAEAAGKQDKFWEMYDLLYSNQADWEGLSNPNENFTSYAKQIGLNLEQYETDFKSSAVSGAINADMKAGTDLGVSSTPTFFINGQIVQTPPVSIAEESFRQMIDATIKEQSEAASQ